MAVHINSAIEFKDRGFLVESMKYRRKKGKMKTQKRQRKRKILAKHILFLFSLIGGLFFLAQQTYIFLITWEDLSIQTIQIECRDTEVREGISQFLNGIELGNFFLLNVRDLQETLKKQPMIKDASVRKMFPATIQVDIMERIPEAYVQMEKVHMIDREGVRIRQTALNQKRRLPLLVDTNLFRRDYDDKLNTAWACLDGITEELKDQISVLDVSREDKIIVHMRDSETRIFIDQNRFQEKLLLLQDIRTRLSQFGSIEYIDLRFQNRIYFKSQSGTGGNTPPKSLKGVK